MRFCNSKREPFPGGKAGGSDQYGNPGDGGNDASRYGRIVTNPEFLPLVPLALPLFATRAEQGKVPGDRLPAAH
jgi:hypothetical protein